MERQTGFELRKLGGERVGPWNEWRRELGRDCFSDLEGSESWGEVNEVVDLCSLVHAVCGSWVFLLEAEDQMVRLQQGLKLLARSGLCSAATEITPKLLC